MKVVEPLKVALECGGHPFQNRILLKKLNREHDRREMLGEEASGTIREKTVTQNAEKYIREAILQDVLKILEADNGEPFEEKKKAITDYLRNCAGDPHAGSLAAIADEERRGLKLNQQFWRAGNVISAGNGITMRPVQESDREGYLEIQRAYLVTKHMLKESAYCNMLWEEHTGNKRLTLSILSDGNYIGYCGINNLLQEPWEIGIELRPGWTGRGIGYRAVSVLLQEIRTRLGRRAFCVRIEPRNRASQRLFEKLGAVPDGLAAAWTDRQEVLIQCEEENLNQIDAELIQLAETFQVPPRKLLSHVLRYSLELKQE